MIHSAKITSSSSYVPLASSSECAMMPAMSPRVVLAKDLSAAIEAGHPWIFDRAIATAPTADAGTVVDIVARGRVMARGYFDPGSPLRVRVLTMDTDAELGGAWARGVAAAAARMRQSDPALVGVSARRLIHGENDGAPGIVIDVYDDTAVVVFDGPGPAAFWRPRLDDVLAGLEDAGLELARVWLRPRGQAAEAYRGGRPPTEIVVREDETRFAVDVVGGQKTGLFLDQRDNRRRVAALSPGATVLNLFSYNGGFSLAAALAGAQRTTSVDIAAPAIDSARRSFELSGLDPAQHGLVVADVFDFAREAIGRGQRFDVVVCDPPSFAPSAKSKAKALKAYRRLADACLELVDVDGALVFASCSSHVRDDDLMAVLGRASAASHRPVRVRGVYGGATDHPVRPGFPEGRYLSAIFSWIAG